MIDRVVEHVFLSGASSVISDSGRQQMLELGITHVLTVSAVAIPPERRIPSVEYYFIFAMDMSCQDLLGGGVLQDGVAYIEKVVADGGNVLVHCEVGISRSVTFVAAYLMRRFTWSSEKALIFIKSARPIAFPNEGFMRQLAIFENLNYQADALSVSRSHEYKQWCLNCGNTPKSGSDEKAATFMRDLELAEGEKPRGNKFRCGKCRQVLFFSEHLVKHNRCDGESCTFGYLIEPMKWMSLEEFQGKVCCPSCGDKLGNYSWGGKQCQGECGLKCQKQVIPWVHLHKTKVDEVTPRIPIDQIQRVVLPPNSIPSVIIS